jgi:hypothetical protein
MLQVFNQRSLSLRLFELAFVIKEINAAINHIIFENKKLQEKYAE